MTVASDVGFPLDRLLQGWLDVPAESVREIRGLCLDSRKVCPGDLFFALAGTLSHGMKHAASAAAFGASAILYDPAKGGVELAQAADLDKAIQSLPLEGLGNKIGYIADRFFGEPSSHIGVIGITGTNGKTSCSHFLACSLGESVPAAVIGTLGWGAQGNLSPLEHTTPNAIEAHSLLAKLVAQGVGYVAMEASSHGLDQGRLNGIRFEGCLFTNLSRDHLDYHLNMQDYLAAKLRLIVWPGLKFMVFNLDDESHRAILECAPGSARKIGFTLNEKIEPKPGIEIVQALAVSHVPEGVSFDIRFDGLQVRLTANVFGGFNVENLLGVTGVLLAKGFDLDEVVRRLSLVSAVPGRMERFRGSFGPTAVVDYAHTPEALYKALISLKPHCQGKLWVVFGCGGNRDRGKRPQMGAIAEKLADQVVLTDDNPRLENGDSIIDEILAGCQRRDILRIRDRGLAIAQALGQAGPSDVVLIAGKGHENAQEIEGIKRPFNDRAIVSKVLGLKQGGGYPCV